ncbi:MAG: transposase [Candidatus Eisenbacteria bacterium]|nr:transposase [Candidatus Eisenbacteria bacterium]
MKGSVTYSVGNLAVIEKGDGLLGGYFEEVFGDVGGKAKDFVPYTELFVYNRLGDCLATNRMLSYPRDLFHRLGFGDMPSERSLYRMVERVGQSHALILERHQEIIKKYGLVTKEQFADFSSSYFEGGAEALGEYGYSREGKPGKKQITFGICTGINGIPSALTIQKGNVPDQKHFGFMLRTAEAVLRPGSVLIFDCGANSKSNKKLVRAKELHYLTLKPKKLGPYRIAIAEFRAGRKCRVVLNDRTYQCVKAKNGDETRYIFYSENLENDQLAIKRSKFSRELVKNHVLLNKTKAGKPLGEYPCEEGIIVAKGSLQKTVDDVANPHINGVEGFFILESSIDDDPLEILKLYKERDRAEKLIRNIKEGTELRPMRHWSKWAIIGYVVLVFLTNFLVNLTLLKAKSQPIVRNVKLLKKYLMSLTVTVVYPPNGFRFHILSNISPEILSIFGNFIDRYRDKTLRLRW